MLPLYLSLFGLLAFSTAWAQSPPAAHCQPPSSTPVTQGVQPSDHVPLADYLALLSKSPLPPKPGRGITSPLSRGAAAAPDAGRIAPGDGRR
jgi:hypothetical protein